MAQALHTIAAIATGGTWVAEEGKQRLVGGRATMETLPWHALRYAHTQAIRAALAEQFQANTANKMLCALRGVVRESWRLGLMPAEDYHRATDLKGIRGTSLQRGRALSRGELAAIFVVCRSDDTPAGRRDAALLALLYGAGLRRSEAVAVKLGDYNTTTGELVVHGKGNKQRLLPITNGTADALAAWIMVRGDAAGPLLSPVNKGGTVLYRAMTAQAVLGVLLKRGAQAKVKHVSPHDLRRSFGTDLLDAGADVLSVQKLMGHANVQTTQRYDRRDERAKRHAVEMLHVPV